MSGEGQQRAVEGGGLANPEQGDSRNNIVTGAVWCSRRDRFNQVEITGLYSLGMERYVGVHRNTSHRRQGISEATLLRDYEFVRMAGAMTP